MPQPSSAASNTVSPEANTTTGPDENSLDLATASTTTTTATVATPKPARTQLFLGTGGYANEDWVGLFYPPTLKKNEWIGFYSTQFNAVELNSPFYAVPGQKAIEGILARAEGRVMLSSKLHQSFSHTLEADQAAAERFLYTFAPARQAGVMGPLLAQFPSRFKNTPDNRDYLAILAKWFVGHELVIEFRHDSWDTLPLYQYIADLGLGVVSLDVPNVRGMPKSSLHKINNQSAYIRLHGRNGNNWWDGQSAAERHDYLYTEAELQPWVQALFAARLQRAYVFFENTTRGQGLENARQFQKLWDAMFL
jgi:uncharacterized protein YecE (DUF72 family)